MVRGLTRAEAEEHLRSYHGLKCSEAYLRDMAWSGKGPAYCRIGGLAVYTIADLAEWVDNKTTQRGYKASELRPKEKAEAA